MSNIKVIEGLKPWEVMKRASEGEPVALWLKASKQWAEATRVGVLNWSDKVAIIDTSTPEIDWDKVNWDFFNQYGGLNILFYGNKNDALLQRKPELSAIPHTTLSESPFYYWAGGEQPVPDNVEVEVVYRDGQIGIPKSIAWMHQGYQDDIIAFRLTGRVK